MRILHLASEYPPQRVFGLGRYVKDLAEEQAKQGHEVTVITNSIGGANAQCIQNNVNVLRVEFPPPPKPKSSSGCLMVFNILLLKRFVENLAGTAPDLDVVCSHDWLTAPAAQAIQELFAIPHVCTFHDTTHGKRFADLTSIDDLFAFNVEKWIVLNASACIANSDSTKQELLREYNCAAGKCEVVPCAIAPDTFEVITDALRLAALRRTVATPNQNIVLYVGRLDVEKGVGVLLDAFASIKDQNSILCVVGSGVLGQSLQARAAELNIQDRVKFLGYIENPVLAHLYKCADVLVCPSLYEPFGMVTLEAMLQGVPVIASDVGGLSDLIEDGITGLKVPPNDIVALKLSIDNCLSSRTKRIEIGRNARQRVLSTRTWSLACNEIVKVYHKIIFQSKPRKENAMFDNTDLVTSPAPDLAIDLDNLLQDQAKFSFPIVGLDREDSMLVEAFRIAVELLPFSRCGLKKVICHGWHHVLGACVLQPLNDRPRIELYVAPLGSESFCAGTREGELLKWANDRVDAFVTKSVNAAMSRRDFSDKQLLRKCFADADELFLLVIAQSMKASIVENLYNISAEVINAGRRVKWLLCLRGILEGIALPPNFSVLDDVSSTVQAEIACVADAIVLPNSSGENLFLTLAAESNIPVLIHSAEADKAARLSNNFRIIDLAEPREVASCLGSLQISEKKFEQSEVSSVNAPIDLVLFNDWGIGDELLLSAVAREIKRCHPQHRVWIRSRYGFDFPKYCERGSPPNSAQHVETIYQNPVLYGPSHASPFPGHLVQQMLDKVAIETGIIVKAESLTPELDGSQFRPTIDGNFVVVHSRPNKRLPSKDWGVERWVDLCKILHQRRYRIVQVGAADDFLLPHVEDFRHLAPARVPEVIAAASLVICVVGYLMHVAAATNTPALVIFGGREHPAIDGYVGQFHLCSDALDCRGRWGCHLAPDENCSNSMKCMEHITPELVANTSESPYEFDRHMRPRKPDDESRPGRSRAC
jgi:glycogen synthase